MSFGSLDVLEIEVKGIPRGWSRWWCG